MDDKQYIGDMDPQELVAVVAEGIKQALQPWLDEINASNEATIALIKEMREAAREFRQQQEGG